MDDQDLRVMGSMCSQSLLIALSAQMTMLQQLTIVLLGAEVLSPQQAASFVRKSANIAGHNTDTQIARLFSAPIQFYEEQLNKFAKTVGKET